MVFFGAMYSFSFFRKMSSHASVTCTSKRSVPKRAMMSSITRADTFSSNFALIAWPCQTWGFWHRMSAKCASSLSRSSSSCHVPWLTSMFPSVGPLPPATQEHAWINARNGGTRGSRRHWRGAAAAAHTIAPIIAPHGHRRQAAGVLLTNQLCGWRHLIAAWKREAQGGLDEGNVVHHHLGLVRGAPLLDI